MPGTEILKFAETLRLALLGDPSALIEFFSFVGKCVVIQSNLWFDNGTSTGIDSLKSFFMKLFKNLTIINVTTVTDNILQVQNFLIIPYRITYRTPNGSINIISITFKFLTKCYSKGCIRSPIIYIEILSNVCHSPGILDKNIYITFHGGATGDSNVNTVYQYNSDGTLINPSFFPPNSAIPTRELRGIIALDNIFYIANSYTNNSLIFKFNPQTNDVSSFSSHLAHPYGITFNPTNELLYVTNQDDNSVSIYELNGTYVHSISLSSSPRGIAADTVNGNIYVALVDDDRVEIFDAVGNKLSKISVKTPIGVFFNSGNQLIYVSSNESGNGHVDVFDRTGTNIETFKTSEHPAGLFVNANFLYVLVQNDEQLLRFNLTTKEETVLIPSLPDIPEQIFLTSAA